ncbi:MAG TPA: hypothetical protein PLS56_01585 [Candidatus Dojkabacteria bacterium]|jgi:hypothetical protein|nr:hypothetical protein [Candidatus Dojkabacteria bacterium]
MTLTEAAFWTKRFGVIAIAGGIVFIIIVLVVTLRPRNQLPPKYLTANFACTENKEEFLEKAKIEIPSLPLASGSEMVFEISTDTGKIDSFQRVVNVYRFNNPTQSINSIGDAKALANKMGFDPDKIVKNGTKSYIWNDSTTGRTLEVQAKNLNFTLKTSTEAMRKATMDSFVPTEQEARTLAASALRSLGRYTSDYSSGAVRTTYIRIGADGSFTRAGSASEAHLIKVDFTRLKSLVTIPSNIVGANDMIKTLTKRLAIQPTQTTQLINDQRVQIYTFDTPVALPRTQDSNVTVYVGVETNTTDVLPNIYEIDYTYWPVDVEACGTYELVSPQYALEMVQSGKGSLVYLYEKDGDYISEYQPKSVKKFIVNKEIFVVYYENYTEMDYMVPVYLISGEAIFTNDTKGEFEFYYPAINYDVIQNKIELPEPVVETKSTSLF